jgi:hypothetical protein
VTNTTRTSWDVYSPRAVDTEPYDAELEPYLELFQKPLTRRKSQFTIKELDAMCKDPLHSPKLIRYLIERIKRM